MADATMVSFPGPLGPGLGENPRRSLPCEPPANPPANPLQTGWKRAGNALQTGCKRAANSLGTPRVRPPHSSKIDARFDPQSRTSACAMATRHRSPLIGQPMAEAPMNVAAQLWARKFSVNHRRLPVCPLAVGSCAASSPRRLLQQHRWVVRGPGRKLDPRRQCLPEELRRASRHRRPLRRRRRPLRHQPRHPDSDGDGLLDGDEDRERDGPTNQDECDGGSDPADNNDLPGADPPPPPPPDADEHGLSDEAEPTSIALTPGQTRCWFPRAAELGGAPIRLCRVGGGSASDPPGECQPRSRSARSW